MVRSVHSPLSATRMLWLHFYPGIAILLFYVAVAPWIASMGYPPLLALILSEIFVLAPLGIGHLAGWTLNGMAARIRESISYAESLPRGQLIGLSLLGIAICVLFYPPLFAAGVWLRHHIFFWLPEWFYDAGFGKYPANALMTTFAIGFFIDGFVGPIVEELYFRGYLLPRMEHLGKFAPVLNAVLFTLYHLWQPHNYPAIFIVALVLSYAAWWKRSIWLSIIIHCAINMTGAITGFLAAHGGVVPY